MLQQTPEPPRRVPPPKPWWADLVTGTILCATILGTVWILKH